MVHTSTMIWILPYVMLFSCVELNDSNVGSCRDGFFMSENGCKECPSYCKLCTSNDSCTTCNDNYFGEYCNKSCEPDCEKCHKEYGYCTFGCPDGQFGTANMLNSCNKCLQNCKLCNSTTSCIECKPGSYGSTCDRPCPNRCTQCNKTTGWCVRCKEEYFIQNGSCHKCNPDCSACLNEHNCSSCRQGFFGPYDGQCVEECPNKSETKQFLSKKGQRCGIVTPTTCQEISSHKPYKCAVKRQCMRSCMAQDRCDDDRTCGLLMSLNCVHDCHPRLRTDSDVAHVDDIEHLCGESCTVDKFEEKTSSSPHCFYANDSFHSNDMSLLEDIGIITCFQEPSKKHDHSDGPNVTVLLLIILLVLVLVVVLVLLSRSRYCNRLQIIPIGSRLLKYFPFQTRRDTAPTRPTPPEDVPQPTIFLDEENIYDVANCIPPSQAMSATAPDNVYDRCRHNPHYAMSTLRRNPTTDVVPDDAYNSCSHSQFGGAIDRDRTYSFATSVDVDLDSEADYVEIATDNDRYDAVIYKPGSECIQEEIYSN